MTAGVRGLPSGLRSTANVPRNHHARLVACSLEMRRPVGAADSSKSLVRVLLIETSGSTWM
ncbi:MAG: hypothetical protein ABR571_00795 [Jatrophihabitans sp.]|uniref:hypothetical protein n=1 Tax=Jatrophihabitans sp. TaxID=1932789 RepID=UPI00391170DE